MHEHIKACQGSALQEILQPKPRYMRPEGALALAIAAVSTSSNLKCQFGLTNLLQVQAGFERFRSGKFVKGEQFSQVNCKKNGDWDVHMRSVKNLSENRMTRIMTQAEAWRAVGSREVGSSRRSTAHVLRSRGSSPPVYSSD